MANWEHRNLDKSFAGAVLAVQRRNAQVAKIERLRVQLDDAQCELSRLDSICWARLPEGCGITLGDTFEVVDHNKEA